MLCVIPSLINWAPRVGNADIHGGRVGYKRKVALLLLLLLDIKERFHCCCCCWIKKKGGIVVANHQPLTSIGGISAFMACDWKNDLDWKKS